jgi:hypothetical protein
MKYLCLVYEDERILGAMPGNEMQAHINAHLDYNDVLRKTGQFKEAEALESVRRATTLRLRDGRITATDGPFAETKEQLTGFYLINAKDRDEAIQIASKIPSVRIGCVEVRPIRPLKRG